MVKTFYGADLESYDIEKDYVSSYIYKFQCWEPMMTNVMLRILEQEKGLCIDVGAYIGYYTFLMGKYNRTYAIEADSFTFQKLVKTHSNSICKDNILLENLAASSKDGEVLNFQHHSEDNVGMSKITQKITDNVVKTTTLDSFIRKIGIENILIMKIDVEGHELDVINGMSHVLEKRLVKYFFLEISPCFVGIDETVRIVETIVENGYDCYDLYNRGQGNLKDYVKYTFLDHKIDNIREFLLRTKATQKDIILIRK